MSRSRWLGMIMWLLVSSGVWGCSTLPPAPEKRPTIQGELGDQVKIQDLAGIWEFEMANTVYPLTFDQQGNGTYEWKQGRFTTTRLEGRVWKGTWHQQDNDREGGFEMLLSPDLQSADGRWWYIRIGQDHDPLNSGGDFILRRAKGNLDVQ